MVGKEICRRVEFRRTNIRVIQDYYLRNNKYPSENCCGMIKRTIYHLPPLYEYDFSMPQDKIDVTFENIVRFNCALYNPKITIIPKGMRNSLSESFGRPSFKEKASDASKPRCNRSVRCSLRNMNKQESNSSLIIVTEYPKSK